MNMRNPVDYVRHQLAVLPLDSVNVSPTPYWKYSRNPELFLGEDANESARVYGLDFMGFRIVTVHGPVSVFILNNHLAGTLTISSNAVADATYGLAEYRWGAEHIHTLFNRLMGAVLPKGAYEFMGDVQDLAAQPH